MILVNLDYKNQGYVVRKSFFDPQVLSNVVTMYAEAFEGFLQHNLNADSPHEIKVMVERRFDSSKSVSLSSRSAFLTGLFGRTFFDHLCPMLNCRSEGFSWNSTIKPVQDRAIYDLIFDKNLLSYVTELLADPIVGPGIYPSFRFNQSDYDLLRHASELATETQREDYSIFNQHIGATPYFTHAAQALPNARDSKMCYAIIPLERSVNEADAYRILPSSHKLLFRDRPQQSELRQAETIKLEIGDVLFVSSRLFVSQLDYQSALAGTSFLQIQFVRRGQFCGRPFLPCTDPLNIPDYDEWRNSWIFALGELAGVDALALRNSVSVNEANELSEFWNERDYDMTKWERLATSSAFSKWIRKTKALFFQATA